MFYIHIGVAKTGTTAIQAGLAGLTGPVRPLPIGLQGPANHRIASALVGSEAPDWCDPMSSEDLSDGMSLLEAGDYVISSEAFCQSAFIRAGGPKALADTFRPATVLMWAREQVGLFNSSFLQEARHEGYTGSVRDYLDRFVVMRHGHMHEIASAYAEHLPIRVFNYHDGDVIDALSHAIGVRVATVEGSENRSPSVLAAMVCQSLSRNLGQKLRGWQFHELRKYADAMLPGSSNATPDDLAEEIRSLFANENARLARDFGVDLSPWLHSPRGDVATPTETEIAEATAQLIVAMAEDVESRKTRAG